ncbi:secreted LysM/SCP-PR1 domain protein [Bacillus phage Stahl]|uniref:Secreted LysM/SCP-PR1 domain protein n=1 Tax=Bacillus phage Stahl TaxID=1610832 RepID=A0A0E3JT82_9CAUD|nr:sporulation protein [Bacillus phage Stahl]AKA61530.1 secreted LysM/SCP-PR1 domain protein [Bacillus phage Stahl]
MKKIVATTALAAALLIPTTSLAATTYTVQPNDTMWKIAVKNKVGVQELINANSSLKNPNLIYVGQKLTIPTQDSSYEQQVIKLVNAERAKAGLKPLKENWELSRVAEFKSKDMRDNNYFDHNSKTYGSPFTMIKNFGISYKTAGENIAAGQKTPEEVMKSWMNSPGHKANILNAGYTQIGVGYVTGGSYGSYWTQQFISQ